jgi:Zn-dependent M28 family amino/carboxypeptidase
MVHLVGNEETFGLYAASRDDLMALSDSTVHSSFFPRLPSIIAGPRLSEALLRPARPAPRVTLILEVRRQPVRGHNVVCLLPGSDRRLRDTAIVFTAHYDHLGIGLPDESGDSIYNGFSDNASGVAMLLAIAKAFRDTPGAQPRHSMLFIFFTGEERGLLGSDYYVAHPSFPLGRMRAVINLDAGAPPARPWNWRIAGGSDSPLGSLAMDVAAARGWTATTSAATPNSDYFPFARWGIPAVFIIPGSGPYEGLSSDSSQALRSRWDHYHQQADGWHHEFPFEGLQRYAEYALMLGLAVDRGPGPVGGS